MAKSSLTTLLNAFYFDDIFTGKPAPSAYVPAVAPRTVTIPAGAPTSAMTAGVAATASTVFTITRMRAGVSVAVGTATFAAGAFAATFSVAAAVAIVAGDQVRVTAPATQDATLADVAWCISGTIF